jgi:hypothetical protein
MSQRALRANSLMLAVSVDQRVTLQAQHVQNREQNSSSRAEFR